MHFNDEVSRLIPHNYVDVSSEGTFMLSCSSQGEGSVMRVRLEGRKEL